MALGREFNPVSSDLRVCDGCFAGLCRWLSAAASEKLGAAGDGMFDEDLGNVQFSGDEEEIEFQQRFSRGDFDVPLGAGAGEDLDAFYEALALEALGEEVPGLSSSALAAGKAQKQEGPFGLTGSACPPCTAPGPNDNGG